MMVVNQQATRQQRARPGEESDVVTPCNQRPMTSSEVCLNNQVNNLLTEQGQLKTDLSKDQRLLAGQNTKYERLLAGQNAKLSRQEEEISQLKQTVEDQVSSISALKSVTGAADTLIAEAGKMYQDRKLLAYHTFEVNEHDWFHTKIDFRHTFKKPPMVLVHSTNAMGDYGYRAEALVWADNITITDFVILTPNPNDSKVKMRNLRFMVFPHLQL